MGACCRNNGGLFNPRESPQPADFSWTRELRSSTGAHAARLSRGTGLSATAAVRDVPVDIDAASVADLVRAGSAHSGHAGLPCRAGVAAGAAVQGVLGQVHAQASAVGSGKGAARAHAFLAGLPGRARFVAAPAMGRAGRRVHADGAAYLRSGGRTHALARDAGLGGGAGNAAPAAVFGAGLRIDAGPGA